MPKRPTLRSAALGTLALVAVLGGFVLAPPASAHKSGGRAEPMIQVEPDAVAGPTGFTPAKIQASYGLSTSPYAGAGQTIAIVDAFDNTNVADDLAVFDASFGLEACGSVCFTKVDQTGGTDYPSAAPVAWSVEIAMDVEWAHAIAPDARILLVEASSDSLANLLAAEQYAGEHANYVSNSWGYPEFSGEAADAGTFSAPGVSYFAAVADAFGKTQYPATAPSVVAVGGTELTPSGSIPWAQGGGGCSAYEPAASAEAGLASEAGCAQHQATPAVSADAVGIPVFDAASGWLNTGGTSFATVLWAAAAADSGQLVTNQAISSGSIPLRPVAGGALLRTGLGELAAIPSTFAQTLKVSLAQIETTV